MDIVQQCHYSNKPMMELYQIRYFLAVCEAMNFTRAAEQCYVSQPALTKAIQKLEDILGGRLFDRSKNAITMTELGLSMQPHLQQIYSTAQHARDFAKQLTEGVETIQLGVMCSIHFNRLLASFIGFLDQSDNTQFTYSEGTFEDLTDKLDKAELDMAILSTPYEIPERFHTQSLYDETYVIAHPPGHPFSNKRKIELAELHKQSYVSRSNCEYATMISDVLEERKIDLIVTQQTHREDWVQEMVRAGMGVAFMPKDSAEAAALPYCDTKDPAFIRQIVMTHLADKPMTGSMKQFEQALSGYKW